MERITYILKKILVFLTNLKTISELLLTDSRSRIIILLTPQYLNYGDIAIQISENEFLNNYTDKKVINVSVHLYIYLKKFVRNHIFPEDTLVLTGGGWLSDLWTFISDECYDILEHFVENKIIIFPQTVYYKKKENITKAYNVFNKHRNLFICLRDKKSYELLCSIMNKPDRLFFLPDMVMLLSEKDKVKRSKRKVGICFRNDTEGILPSDTVKKIYNLLEKKQFHIKKIATAFYRCPIIVPYSIARILTENKIRQINKCTLLITDRLHGMIFAAITGTPCIAFDNISKKVSGVSYWLSGLNYIYVVSDNFDEKRLEEIFDNILILNNTNYVNNNRKNMIQTLKKLIEMT